MRIGVGQSLLLAGLIGCASPLLSQQAASGDEATTATTVRQMTGRQAMEKLVARYADAKTYTADLKRTVVDKNGMREPKEPLVKLTIAYESPEKLNIRGDSYRLVSDGEWTMMSLDKQQSFVRLPAPDDLSSKSLFHRSVFFSDAKVYPAVDLLTGSFEMIPARVKTIVMDDRETVHLTFNDPHTLQLFMDAETGQLTRSLYPFTGDGEYWLQVDYSGEKLNAEVDKTAFSTEMPKDFYDYTEMAKRADPNYYYNHAMEKVGENAPAFTLSSLKGEKVSIADARGKVVVLDFWATYCPPCIQSIPAVEEAMEQFKPEEVQLWGMNRDYGHGRQELIREFMQRHDMDNLQLLMDSDDLAAQYHAPMMPTFVIVDQEGIIRDMIVGPILDSAMLTSRIEPLLDKQAE